MEPTNSGRVDQWSHCVESRYTELIRLCFQHKWIASLGAVSTVLCTPLPKLVENPLSRGGHTHTRLLKTTLLSLSENVL